ncbi:MAG: sel1 repeat family protein [Xanthomonadales bacterium]|nr:sel1 repeat family protein [Xanthomonadales bacterium]
MAVMLVGAPAHAVQGEITSHPGFLAGHPDLRWRALGHEALEARRAEQAFDHFRRSALYADKASQAAVAEMLWSGIGTRQDRPLAYAWMDVAAERGYEKLLIQRERYWAALTPEQQATAIQVGEDVYARYGDDVAKPRMENELRRARSQVTGSRVGRVGTLTVPGALDLHGTKSVLNVGSLGSVTDGSLYFAEKYWEPAAYWEWQDAQWRPADAASARR